MSANKSAVSLLLVAITITLLLLTYLFISPESLPEPAPSEPAGLPSEDGKEARNFSARASGRFLDSAGGEVRIVTGFSGESPEFQSLLESSRLIERIPAKVESAYRELESSGFEMPATISLRFVEGARSEFNYSEQVVILPAHSLRSRERLDALIMHEMHHVAQFETSGANFRYPNWFVEGPAEYFRKDGNCNVSADRWSPINFSAVQYSERSYWEGCVATKVLVEELDADLAEIYRDLSPVQGSLEESLMEHADVSYRKLERMTYEAIFGDSAAEER